MTARYAPLPPAIDSLHGFDKALVTGAGGFVGRHLCAALERAGKRVVRASSRCGFDPKQDPLPLDGVGHVFHVGARTSVPAAWQDPVGFLESNTIGAAHVLDQCKLAGCRITFLSAYIYGSPVALPIHESHPVNVGNPYALSKYLAEQICKFYVDVFQLHVITLRLFNVYGPGQDERFLIPSICRQVLDDSCAMVEVLDLAPRRDYVFVDDVVEAILSSVGAPPGSIFNVGSGHAFSVEEVINHVCRIARINKPYRASQQRRPNEIDVTKADISALSRAVGWSPRTSFEDGLSRMIQDMRATWRS